jgi:hypothetical protein
MSGFPGRPGSRLNLLASLLCVTVAMGSCGRPDGPPEPRSSERPAGTPSALPATSSSRFGTLLARRVDVDGDVEAVGARGVQVVDGSTIDRNLQLQQGRSATVLDSEIQGDLVSMPRQPVPIPDHHPRIAHFRPYLWGDAIPAQTVAYRLGYRFVDNNGQSDAEYTVWGVHWADLREYPYVWTGRYDDKGREIRKLRGVRPRIQHMPTEFVGRLRSAKHGGRRPKKMFHHMRRAAALDKRRPAWHPFTLCIEVKGSPGFLLRETWRRLNLETRFTEARIVIMTLQDIPGWRQRLELAHEFGFATALLPRLAKPADWPHFVEMGVQKWGSFK